MRLKTLSITNFRRISSLNVTFPAGLAIIVGENNAGKTTVIDALRLMLFPSRDFNALRLNEDDFNKDAKGEPIEISCTFADLTLDEEAQFIECLVSLGDDKFEARINLRAELNPISDRVNFRWWGGETEGGSLPSNLYDFISSVYLQPLRDPESGLRPGRHSQVARLIKKLTPEESEAAFESIIQKANDEVKELPTVKDARNEINQQMQNVAGKELAQEIELIFNDPTFSHIVGGLFPKVDGLPFGLNGLGYNNLVYTAVTLGALQKNDQFSHRSILIEEPEAHLHPQLQVLLLRYLSAVSAQNGGNQVQIIVTSHSPILASQASVDSIISLHETIDGELRAISIAQLPYDEIKKKKLRRFLDATRGELFFARRILMVEGIAEVLLLPPLTRAAGGDLCDSAITIVNADGINFDAFLPLFGALGMECPIAILSDGDAPQIGGAHSPSAEALKAQAGAIANLRVSLSERSFEHELARNPTVLMKMVAAYKILHPHLGVNVENALAPIVGADAKADYFYTEVFKNRETSKGRFAQELAQILDDQPIQRQNVPVYIIEALVHLGVIENNINAAGDA